MVKNFILIVTSIIIIISFLNPISALGGLHAFWQRSFSSIDICNEPNYSPIVPGLYLSNARTACELRILERLQITHILTIETRKLPKNIYDSGNFTTLFIKLSDAPTSNIMRYFPICNEFINKARKNGTILVHCHVGVSRSATIVIAYMMEKYQMTYQDAFDYVRQRRKFINPNPGFVRQLIEYEKAGYKVSGFNKLEVFGIKYKYKLLSAAAVVVGLIVPLILLVNKVF